MCAASCCRTTGRTGTVSRPFEHWQHVQRHVSSRCARDTQLSHLSWTDRLRRFFRRYFVGEGGGLVFIRWISLPPDGICCGGLWIGTTTVPVLTAGGSG